MNFLQFIRDYAPAYCGVNPAFGRVAELVFDEEIKGNSEFAADKFKDARERAMLVLPFQAKDEYKYNLCLDVVEMAILNHRQANHAEDNSLRLSQLNKSQMSPEMLEVGTLEWWNG